MMNRYTVLAALSAFAWSVAGMAETASCEAGGKLNLDVSKASFSVSLADKDWRPLSASGGYAPSADGTYAFAVKRDGATIVDGRARFTRDGSALKAEWKFTAQRDFDGNAFNLDIALPCDSFGGGELVAPGKTFALPATMPENNMFGGCSAKSFDVKGPKGAFRVEFDSARWFGVQDNRKWNTPGFSVRATVGDKSFRKGAAFAVALTITAPEGITDLVSGPVTVTAGPSWIPIRDSTDIVPGSAIDFSRQGWLEAPAGKHGRVVAKGAHFEFAKKPGVPQRFYGVNLCFDANYPSREQADEFAARLARTGYNSLRIHHYEQMLTEGAADGTQINPKRMAQLDDLAAACIEKGIYLTTDLYVSRRPSWRAIGVDRDGYCSDYKDLCLFHPGAYSNLCSFARQFLTHVNPRTGRRWADEPALAWIALINEGNPGNYGFGVYKKYPEAWNRWKAWLAEKKRTEPVLYADVSEDSVPDNAWETSKPARAFALFLLDLERDFDARFMKFLREDLGCAALYSSMSSWYNPVGYQFARQAYDYVDDHFYVDHPSFLEGSWRLPSRCPNTNPARGEAAGFQGVVNHRLLDKPFTITEFNFSGPGRWRGVGGIMLGAQAALQDYDGIWRFAWSHNIGGLLNPQSLAYFDTAKDPLTRVTERAALCLFLRRDMPVLRNTSPILVGSGKDDAALSRGGRAAFKNLWFGWYSKLGTMIGDAAPKGSFCSFALPGAESTTDAELKAKLGNARSGDGHVSLDRENGTFGVTSARTCGFSCEGGRAVAGPLTADISLAPSAVWASSLDGKPIENSRRILLSHVTDVQDEGITYADREKRVLVKWGRLPHLMQRGRAEIALRLTGKAPKVYALAADGARRGEVESKFAHGLLTFAADTAREADEATFMYEIVR